MLATHSDLWGPIATCRYPWGPMGTYKHLWGPKGTYGDSWGSMGTYREVWGGDLWGTMGNFGDVFSVMSQLWASERAAHRVESSLPKRHCRTRPGILGQRPPPDMAPTKRRKLVTLEDPWGMAHT